MRIGIISDIHNNILALDRTLNYFEANNCKKIICYGDIIGIGPFPEETVRRVMSLDNLICVKGNHEDYLINAIDNKPFPVSMESEEAKHHIWEHSLLSEKSKEFLIHLPREKTISAYGINILVIHYSMGSKNNYNNAVQNLTLCQCEQMFDSIDADMVIFGHSHKQSVHQNAKTHYINIGSLGCPAKSKNVARAGMLNLEDGKVIFENVELIYDVSAVIAEIDRLRYPASSEIKQIFYGLWEKK